jgi:hypothetical protein
VADLFETITASVLENLQASITAGKARVSYHDLTHAADPFVQDIFRRQFEQDFASERQRIVSGSLSASVRYDASAVTQQVERLMTELKKQLSFDTVEVSAVLKESLLTRVRFLVVPGQTSESVIFKSHSSRAVPDIVRFLREFGKYRYYPDALEKYAVSKNIRFLSRGQFQLLIAEINQSLFSRDGLDNVLKACALIIQEINGLRGLAAESVPIDLLILAFEDRGLKDFALALSVEKELGNLEIDLYSLRQVLNRFQILRMKKGVAAEDAPPASGTTGKVIAEAVRKDDSGEVIDIDAILSKQKREDTDSHKRAILERGVSDQTGDDVVLPELKPSDVTGQFVKEELVDGFCEDTSAIKLTELKESESLLLLDSLMTDKDRKLLVKAIFNDQPNKLDELIHQVNRAKTWKEAIAVLDDCLSANGVDPYQKEAVRLSDLVYMRYYPPEKK